MLSPGCSGVIEQGPANTSAVGAPLSVSTGARCETPGCNLGVLRQGLQVYWNELEVGCLIHSFFGNGEGRVYRLLQSRCPILEKQGRARALSFMSRCRVEVEQQSRSSGQFIF
ncbi:uncharacterized protein LOC113564049 [Drosophila erecta]|uniref:uncharacterized protein LOC113564048 n=1 Tax=Drosophila erecta TaxID=7220 RepID=UPI000F05D9C1|nr:uncharacterized protein LOC113564048 [Drosophila erecta]XP_026834176.1 uncharacterized protein LOC113564049 [Drosophila erecta]